MQPFQLVDGSEDNPPPPTSHPRQSRTPDVEAHPAGVDRRTPRAPPVRARPRAPPIRAPPHYRRWYKSSKICGIIAVVLLSFYSFFLAGAVVAKVRPVPKTLFSQSLEVTLIFTAGLYICALSSATVLVGMFGAWACSSPRFTGSRGCAHCGICFVVSTSVFIIYAALIGIAWSIPLFAAPRINYPKACSGAWIEVELESPRHREISYRQSIATFSRINQGHREHLFAFATSGADSAEFNLVPVNNTMPSILPSLQGIRLDDRTNHIQGRCYKADNDTNSTPCGVVGYIWPFSEDGPLSFELWYTAADGSTAMLRARNEYRNWSLEDKPFILLHRASSDDWKLGERLLQTTIPEPPGCTGRTKLCISRTADRGDGVLGPDLLVAVRWISHIWAACVLDCSTPSS